jgi:hypothetical protein
MPSSMISRSPTYLMTYPALDGANDLRRGGHSPAREPEWDEEGLRMEPLSVVATPGSHLVASGIPRYDWGLVSDQGG